MGCKVNIEVLAYRMKKRHTGENEGTEAEIYCACLQ
jgi:hypothetical protein